MAQYREIKEKHDDCVLLFRVGDFYETFFEDAIDISRLLNIALTTRDKKVLEAIGKDSTGFGEADVTKYELVREGMDKAEKFLEGGLSASMSVHDWPFYAISIALTHQVTGIPLLQAAWLLNSIFLAALPLALVRLCGNAGGSRRARRSGKASGCRWCRARPAAAPG